MSTFPTPDSPEPRWHSYTDAAEYLQCTERQLRRWVSERKIAHTRMGLYTRFSREQLDAFVAAHTVEVER